MPSRCDRRTPVVVPFTALVLGAVVALGAVACEPGEPPPQPAEEDAAKIQERVAANEALARQYTDAYNDRDVATLEEILADNIELGGEAMTRSEFLTLAQGYWEAFPDLRFEDPRILAGEDHAVVHVTFHATGAGEFVGHDIDGREVRASEMILFTMADGKIWEYTYEWDELGFWAQLGIIDVSPIEP